MPCYIQFFDAKSISSRSSNDNRFKEGILHDNSSDYFIYLYCYKFMPINVNKFFKDILTRVPTFSSIPPEGL